MPDDLSPEVIAEGIRLDAARTPGEWLAEEGGGVAYDADSNPVADRGGEFDAAFIAHASRHYGAALAQLERQAAELARLRRDLDAALNVLAEHDIGLPGMLLPLKKDVQIATLAAERDALRADLARAREEIDELRERTVIAETLRHNEAASLSRTREAAAGLAGALELAKEAAADAVACIDTPGSECCPAAIRHAIGVSEAQLAAWRASLGAP